VANYKNVTIPTNIDVSEQAREQFGAFYAALFDRTLEQNPGAVVTEYSWLSGFCDPCPGVPLTVAEIGALGADVMGGTVDEGELETYVLTRLHARYGKDALGEDLVFKEAAPIQGGRERPGPPDGRLETGARPSDNNNFQGRYAIRHPWTGPIDCEQPKRGEWGEPPDGGGRRLKVATDLAFAPRGTLQLASIVQHDVPEVSLKAASPSVSHAGEVPPGQAAPRGQAVQRGGSCGACRVGDRGDAPALGAVLASVVAALAWLARRRKA
jgi:hypothetical protein